MLRLFCLLSVCWPLWTSAQTTSTALPATKYLLLADYKQAVHHVVTYRTSLTYRHDSTATVEIFNILLPRPGSSDSLLITCSVLPSAEGDLRWRQVPLDSIPKTQLVPRVQLVQEAQQRLMAFEQAGRPPTRTLLSSLDFLPLVERQGKYYLPQATVLTSFLLLKPGVVHTVAQASLALIDVKSPVFATDDLLKAAIKRTGNPHAQLWAVLVAGNLLQGRNHGRYEFWSNVQPQSHPGLLHEGIGSFLYQPGIGIVSGKYETYFSSHGPFIDYFLDIVSVDGKPSKNP
ncbi:MAG: hypothetical protein EOO61_16895 [Hymenobacter sp.]|nr:MAG: hypothetical protein EOO61_16895 [Hymenobacter sp.]